MESVVSESHGVRKDENPAASNGHRAATQKVGKPAVCRIGRGRWSLVAAKFPFDLEEFTFGRRTTQNLRDSRESRAAACAEFSDTLFSARRSRKTSSDFRRTRHQPCGEVCQASMAPSSIQCITVSGERPAICAASLSEISVAESVIAFSQREPLNRGVSYVGRISEWDDGRRCYFPAENSAPPPTIKRGDSGCVTSTGRPRAWRRGVLPAS
jgi:hypothetical protein